MSHLGLLLTAASAWTGFRPQAISRQRVLRVAHSLELTGLTSRELEERLERREPELLQRLAEALAVGETYFFRQQDHFHFITREVIPARLSSGVRRFRAWSAGCATGEEAWSLAACLRAALPRELEVEVQGTDLLERHIEAARLGRYRKWSVRGPQPLPVLRRRGEDFEVDEQLRSRVTFHVENLLVPHADPSPRYDLVLCRNVLVYFSPEAARLALRNILALMAPGGYLLLGPADAQELPEELVRVGDAGLQAFVRGFPARPAPAPSPPPRRAHVRLAPAPAAPPTPEPRSGPVAQHVRVLEELERGNRQGAARMLDLLLSREADYLPALLERALLHRRCGEVSAARRCAESLLARAATLPLEGRVPGPEPLTIEYYLTAARAFLGVEEQQP